MVEVFYSTNYFKSCLLVMAAVYTQFYPAQNNFYKMLSMQNKKICRKVSKEKSSVLILMLSELSSEDNIHSL
jgi:hypothetical protein